MGTALVLQPDGKLVAEDRMGLLLGRFNANGSLDQTFGFGGWTTAVAGAMGLALAQQPDGKLAAGGPLGGDFTLARHNADGTVDGTFGTGGIVTTDFGRTDAATPLVLQPDGKLVVGGSARSSRRAR
jgi:uncharacterized delta-60 repeat protein